MTAVLAKPAPPVQRPLNPAADRRFAEAASFAQSGRWRQAETAWRAGLRLKPSDLAGWVGLADALRQQQQADAAIAAAQQALQIDPSSSAAIYVVIVCMAQQNRHAELARWLQPRAEAGLLNHIGWTEYGQALYRSGQHQAAVHAVMQALAHKLDYTPAYVVLGNALERMSLPGAAIEAFRTAVTLNPAETEVWCGLIYYSQHACLWNTLADDLLGLEASLLGRDGRASGVINPFSMLTMPYGAARQLAAFRGYSQRWFGAVKPALHPAAVQAARKRDPAARIKLGYLSADYCAHATATLVTELFEKHDRSRFEVVLYSFGLDDGSEQRKRIVASADRFVELSSLSDEAAARSIQRDGIDVLIDLKGHTRDARSAILAWRPAAVQVNYLGFPGTMGAQFIDYLITDAVITPLDHAPNYAEQLAYLPNSYQPNDRQRHIGAPLSRAELGLPADALVLCCFNNNYKITAAMFDVWCRLLAQVPSAVLWLLESNPQARTNLQREAQARGIADERIVFSKGALPAIHLARLQLADLFLDTLPVNAHTTASDALWAGLPVLTCPGETFVSRVAASLVAACGLPEFVVDSIEAYEREALALMHAPERLAAARAHLVDTRMNSPLFDSTRYTRDLECLYQRMVERSGAGLAAEHLMPAHAWTAQASA